MRRKFDHEALDNLVHQLLYMRSRDSHISVDDEVVSQICQKVTSIFLSESSVISLSAPINICGDIHGQFHNLLRVFEIGGLPPRSKYLFLGDYVDRGDRSVEVILLLFGLKIKFPDHIFLLRGNHETAEMAESFGFADECMKKLNRHMLNSFLRVFDALPIGAVVEKRFFCVHGGLSPHLRYLRDIKAIRRPSLVSDHALLNDLLWSDPDPNISEWGPSTRGSTVTWGIQAVIGFFQRTGLTHIIRGHQVARDGFEYPFSGNTKVITIFTASGPGSVNGDRSAFISIGGDLSMVFEVLSSRRRRWRRRRRRN